MRNEFEALIKAAKDYKEYQSIGNGAKLNCAIEAAELALQQPDVMLCWVSILERLPNESDYYIVFSTAGIHIEWFRKEDGKFGARNGSELLVTYWMVKPPKPNRA